MVSYRLEILVGIYYRDEDIFLEIGGFRSPLFLLIAICACIFAEHAQA